MDSGRSTTRQSSGSEVGPIGGKPGTRGTRGSTGTRGSGTGPRSGAGMVGLRRRGAVRFGGGARRRRTGRRRGPFGSGTAPNTYGQLVSCGSAGSSSKSGPGSGCSGDGAF